METGTVVSLTGGNGAIGSKILLHLLESDKNLKVRVLLFHQEKLKKATALALKKYKDRIELIRGTTSDISVCKRLVSDASYLIHTSGLIPPKSEHDPKGAYESNFIGTKNLVDAIKNSPDKDKIKFIYISSVAVYGNRTEKHLWARVGDPVISSDYDEYSYTKILAERYVLEAGLKYFVVLRQTAVAHSYLFKNNLSDGLIYQACLNAPYEWVTDNDTAVLFTHLVEYDLEGRLDGFFNRIYNIGGGKENRITGYESMNKGFSLMGRDLKAFMDPNFFSTRNFHGAFFYDGDVLESYLHYQSETIDYFWKEMGKKYWYFHLGRLVPPSFLRKHLFLKLCDYDDAPLYWVKHKEDYKVKAFYGGYDKFEQIPKSWSDYNLLCENKDSQGNFIDFEKFKDPLYAKEHGQLLDHGFDDTKKLDEITLEDVKKAVNYRGGLCLSETMVKGDLFTKLTFQCHKGHTFKASPYTILYGGHFCPNCFEKPWKNGRIAKFSKFHAQLYYADHDKEEEDDIYPPKN